MADIQQAGKLVFPGVGAFAQAMGRLNSLGYTEALKDYVQVSLAQAMQSAVCMHVVCAGQLFVQQISWHSPLCLTGILHVRALHIGHLLVAWQQKNDTFFFFQDWGFEVCGPAGAILGQRGETAATSVTA